MAPKNQKKNTTKAGVAGAKNGIKKPPKKTALEKLMANSKESLEKRANEELVQVHNITAKINDKKAKWAAEEARDLAKLKRHKDEYKALKDQAAAALTAEGLARSVNARSEALKDEMAVTIKEEAVTIKEEDRD
ncbi:hypothetical protein NEUTE1DRAFT_147535 [Neurospora tetrasperma FGSC 2508]|uniref:Uncharacterized protein n=1 Tax=Neurospora tetrasperma (strain FGSC 2508 / ATCC MYA-4615 / P0657) TaxID=510951 RepID=F8MP57_NEUT8|nr:uncharacterized protein NEUTE1DRAFT_147535 [Neurospora tetrasperma FGSC 2508]EGO57069.1 hypothetical protein NEUTE1DRAFT_147535 [Neurospora tetrasperma FGSC 2508]